MTDRLTSDMSFWLKFVRDANVSATNSAVLQYSMALADRFSTTSELLTVDESELKKIGINNQADRNRLIAQARSLDEKANQPLTLKKRSAMANRVIESWLGEAPTTSLNRNALSKSTCNLSPALLSRISFKDRPVSVAYPYAEPENDVRKRNFSHLLETDEKVLTVDNNGKVQAKRNSTTLEYHGVLKKSPSTPAHGLRTLKSLSDTISVQKKIPLGTDRLKRLDSTTSLFQRQTSFITKKVTTLANKLVNPFANLKKKVDSSTTDLTSTDSQIDLRASMKRQCFLMETPDESIKPVCRTVTISSLKRTREDDEPKVEQRKVQVLNVNNQLGQPTGLFSYDEAEEPKRTAVPVQTLGSKRFKLGATTSFLTRSLANHGLME